MAFWFVSKNTENKAFVVAGFIFCALGDVLLALSFPHNFVVGLIAFLFAHLFFAAYFFRLRNWRKHKVLPITIAVGLMLAAAFVVLPVTGVMFWPVSAYMLVILSMAIMAVLAERNSPTLMAGAFMFMFSDLLIGINRFVIAIPLENIMIMLTYYAALYLIAIGIHKRVTM